MTSSQGLAPAPPLMAPVGPTRRSHSYHNATMEVNPSGQREPREGRVPLRARHGARLRLQHGSARSRATLDLGLLASSGLAAHIDAIPARLDRAPPDRVAVHKGLIRRVPATQGYELTDYRLGGPRKLPATLTRRPSRHLSGATKVAAPMSPS